MAKLPPDVAQAAQEAEPSIGFTPVPAGIYRVKCIKYKATTPQKSDPKKSNAEWVLKIEQDGVRAVQLWHTVSHASEAAGMMHAAYDAFGLTLDSDEEEFIGEYCLADLTVIEQQQGKNKGRQINDINSLLPLSGAVGEGGQPRAATAEEDPWA